MSEISVRLLDAIPSDRDVVAVVVQTDSDSQLPDNSVASIAKTVKAKFGNEVLTIILHKGETVELLDDRAMNMRGWIRLPGSGVHEGETSEGHPSDLDS